MCISSSRDTASGQTAAVEGGRGEERRGRTEERGGRGEERGRERREGGRGEREVGEGGKRVVLIFLARKIMVDVFSTDRQTSISNSTVGTSGFGSVMYGSKEVEPIDKTE